MATSTFGKLFSAPTGKNQHSFVEEMSKTVPPTLDKDFQSNLVIHPSQDEDLHTNLIKALGK